MVCINTSGKLFLSKKNNYGLYSLSIQLLAYDLLPPHSQLGVVFS